MRKSLSVLVVALVACPVAPAFAENAGVVKSEKAEPVSVDVPEGMMVIVLPDGSGYILAPGSPKDLKLGSDGTTIIGSRNPRGAQIIGHGKNLAVSTESIDPIMYDDGGGRSCGDAWCGTLRQHQDPRIGWYCGGPCKNCNGIKACP